MNLQEIQAVMDKAAVKTRPVRETLLIENPADILKAAAAMKGAGFNFLSSVTAADYLQFLECVYHFDDLSQKGRSAVLRARVPRDSAKLPSVTPVYRGAEYQEREAYDTYGIIFDGHNDLRRIFMWDGFEGFPLRKDYQQEDSETLEAADVEWLAKHNVKVPDEMKKKAEELKQQGKRALAQKPGQPEPA